MLVAGAGEYNKAKVGRTALLDAVYKDIKPDARVGKTIDVYFPDVGPLPGHQQRPAHGDVGQSQLHPTGVPDPGRSCFAVPGLRAMASAVDIAQKFFDPLYKRARQYLNGQIAALITTSNFNSNVPIMAQRRARFRSPTSSTRVAAGQPESASGGLGQTATDGAQPGVPQDAWRQRLGTRDFVSAVIAKEARERADLAHAFNFQVIWDQQMPTASGAILYGQVSVTNGSSAITGLNTAFTQQLVASSSYLVFGNDPTKTEYKVNTVDE